MFGRAFKVGSIGGVPIRVAPTWVLIVALYVYSIWAQLQQEYPGVTSGRALGLAGFTTFLFFGSVLLHELAHAGVARGYDLPVSGITLVLWGGFTQITRRIRKPATDFLVSAAGPATSLLYGAVLFATARLLPDQGGPVAGAVGYVGLLSMILGGLNAVPGWPVLDGGNMLRAVVWSVTGDESRSDRVAGTVGLVTGIALAAWGVWLMMRRSAFSGYGIWLVLLGVSVAQAARQAGEQRRLVGALAGGTAEQAMGPPPPSIPADMSMSEALDRFLRGHEGQAFPVVEDGKVVGMASFDSVRRIGSEDPMRPVREGVIPLRDVVVIEATEPLDQVASKLDGERMGLVLRNGEPAGAISAHDLFRWATRRAPP